MTKINEELELIAPGIVRNCIDTVEDILRDWRDTCTDAGKTENLKITLFCRRRCFLKNALLLQVYTFTH